MLPKPNVEVALSGDLGKMTEAKVKGMFCNPIYTGVAPYPRIISDSEWIQAALKEITEDGPTQFLVNMLYVLHQTLPIEDDSSS